MVDVAVEIWVHLWLQNATEHSKLRHLFGLEVFWRIENFAVSVPKNVG